MDAPGTPSPRKTDCQSLISPHSSPIPTRGQQHPTFKHDRHDPHNQFKLTLTPIKHNTTDTNNAWTPTTQHTQRHHKPLEHNPYISILNDTYIVIHTHLNETPYTLE